MNSHIWKFLVFVLVSGCGDGDCCTGPIMCTKEIRYGISVDVVDAASQIPKADGSTMTIRDGNYVESTTTQGNGLTMVGAPERAGTYIVTVAHSGYHTWIRTDVVVTKDVCHVQTVSLRAELEKI